jgi:hypothetical protein
MVGRPVAFDMLLAKKATSMHTAIPKNSGKWLRTTDGSGETDEYSCRAIVMVRNPVFVAGYP